MIYKLRRRFILISATSILAVVTLVENHKGEITAYKKDDTHIGFKVVL